MKSAIIYASIHHGNTKKLVEALSEKYPIDATIVKEADLSEYDLIGIASGIYGGQFHQSVRGFIAKNLPEGKKIFFLMTSAMNKDFSKSMDGSLTGKDPIVMGKFFCRGYNTFGPFKLIGGTSKGHPDEEDIRNVIDFYQSIIDNI